MITGRNIYKSEKLIKILLEYDERTKIINSIKITGDFFIYPEESLDELEVNLIGTKLEKDAVNQKIEKCLNYSEAFGFDSKSMTDAILGCLKQKQNEEQQQEEEGRKKLKGK